MFGFVARLAALPGGFTALLETIGLVAGFDDVAMVIFKSASTAHGYACGRRVEIKTRFNCVYPIRRGGVVFAIDSGGGGHGLEHEWRAQK